MPHQEKNIYASLISAALIFGAYFWYVYALYQDGGFDGADANSLIGKSILGLIIGGIIINIIMHIVINIIFAALENDPKPSFVVDERDKLIELRALRVSYYIFGAGYVASMIALAMGQTTFMVFNLIILSCAIATVTEALFQLALYRRGF